MSDLCMVAMSYGHFVLKKYNISSLLFNFLDSNSLSRNESEKLAESGSSAEESDGDSENEDNRKVSIQSKISLLLFFNTL